MKNVSTTIAAQYINSLTIRQLIDSMNEYFDPATDFKNFYDFVWNIDTAKGFGLDIWGRIVNVGRDLTISADPDYLGFQNAAPAQPFGQAPMYNSEAATKTYRLSDDIYRILILTKALANISASSIPSLNRLLQSLFKGRGRAYVLELGAMKIQYTFEFLLKPYEMAILTQSGVITSPAGVSWSVLQIPKDSTLGFDEGDGQPFGSGVFFNS